MPRVLVVDDTDDILTLVHGVTRRMGLLTATLNNSARFMTTFVRFKPDIIVLDIVMPNVDGIEIIHWLTDVGYAGRLIVMSGYADGDRLGRALSDAHERMAIALLRKPFRIAELKAALSGEPAPTVPDGFMSFAAC
ncbi:MAG TPA: response regulator [Dongiaceae bacterium]|nr:response regulator [Dongiaceae bacterium]